MQTKWLEIIIIHYKYTNDMNTSEIKQFNCLLSRRKVNLIYKYFKLILWPEVKIKI